MSTSDYFSKASTFSFFSLFLTPSPHPKPLALFFAWLLLDPHIRVSRDKQTTALQDDAIQQAQCERVFTDKMSGMRDDPYLLIAGGTYLGTSSLRKNKRSS